MAIHEQPKRPRYGSQTDAYGQTVLIKFFNDAWYCIGYARPISRHTSERNARDYVQFTWRNYVLKVLDINGYLSVENNLKPELKATRPGKIFVDEDASLPAWLPMGKTP